MGRRAVTALTFSTTFENDIDAFGEAEGSVADDFHEDFGLEDDELDEANDTVAEVYVEEEYYSSFFHMTSSPT